MVNYDRRTARDYDRRVAYSSSTYEDQIVEIRQPFVDEIGARLQRDLTHGNDDVWTQQSTKRLNKGWFLASVKGGPGSGQGQIITVNVQFDRGTIEVDAKMGRVRLYKKQRPENISSAFIAESITSEYKRYTH